MIVFSNIFFLNFVLYAGNLDIYGVRLVLVYMHTGG